MTRARELANFADDTAGLETLTVSDITDLSVSASNINSATNQITDSSTDLNVDSNTLVVDKSANAVGIGTASPAKLLSLEGVSTQGMRIGVTGQSYYHEVLSNGDGLKLSADSSNAGGSGADIRFDVAGDEKMRIKKNGRLGIGTDNPTYRFDCETDVNGEWIGTFRNTSDHTGSNGIAVDIGANNNANNYIFLARHNDGNNTALAVRGDGKTGIGITSPSTTLHIYKTGLADASTTALLTIDGKFVSNTIDSSDATGIAFRLENALGGSQTTTCIASSYSASYNHLLLQPAGGNIGIGTNNPESRVEIYGNSNTTSSITLRNTNPNPDSHWQITPVYDADVLAFRSANNSYANRLTISGGGDVTIPSGSLGIGTSLPDGNLEVVGSQTTNGVHFKTGGGSANAYIFKASNYAGTEYFRIHSTGRVGIGTGSNNPDATILTGKTSGSNNAEIYLGATGSGQAGVVFDASNGDFSGSDYYMLRQIDSTLDVENWLGISGDYIWKTNAGTERVRLKNDGTLQHVSGQTQLTKEQYAYSTSSFSSDGNWHTMLSGLNAHHVFLVRAYASGGGFHTSALFIVANTYASGNIWSFSSGSGWSSNIELRWTGSTYNYNLEGRNTGSNTANTFWRIKQINI